MSKQSGKPAGLPVIHDADYAGARIQRMQKALTLMNLQLHHVVSHVTGVTGMRIIRAIVGGQRDPAVLATMRDDRATRCFSAKRRSTLRGSRCEVRLDRHATKHLSLAARLAEYGMTPSMGRKGNCWGNAPSESFFNSLKNERVHGTTCVRTFSDARVVGGEGFEPPTPTV